MLHRKDLLGLYDLTAEEIQSILTTAAQMKDKLRSGEPGAEEMCHPRVWELLTQNGGMGTRTISCFRKEYSFLSNILEEFQNSKVFSEDLKKFACEDIRS